MASIKCFSTFFNISSIVIPHYDSATRAQVLALRAYSIEAKEIQEITRISKRTQRKWLSAAKEKGFELKKDSYLIINIFVQDKPKSGRPKKLTSKQV